MTHNYSIYLLERGKFRYLDVDDVLPEGVCELFFSPKDFKL